MKKEFSQPDFDNETLKCPKCGWEGTGLKANLFDLYGLTGGSEVHCPACDEKLGILKRNEAPPGESATDLSFQIG